jgi:hypothetical protein
MEVGMVIPARTVTYGNILFDCIFLAIFIVLLILSKQKLALIVGILAGLLYFLVDWGIFYHALGTRVVVGANPTLFLFWLSMSMGLTNFVWIWLWLNRDKNLLGWSIFIVSGWLMVNLMAKNFFPEWGSIFIQRGTGSYHGVMALILFLGYGFLLVRNLLYGGWKGKRIDILWLLIIGILVQFGWEFVLLITGIRNPGFLPLVVNSLLETNLGLPLMFFIHSAVCDKYGQNGKKKR